MCSIPPPPLFWRIPINLKIPEIELFLKKAFAHLVTNWTHFLYFFHLSKRSRLRDCSIYKSGRGSINLKFLKLISPILPDMKDEKMWHKFEKSVGKEKEIQSSHCLGFSQQKNISRSAYSGRNHQYLSIYKNFFNDDLQFGRICERSGGGGIYILLIARFF